MAVRLHRCDSYRLRLSLEDRLSDSEQAELATHLESCEFCRLELERLAAASQLWGEARLLGGEAEPGASPTIGLAHGTLDAEDAVTDLTAGSSAWLEFLDPPHPDQPGTLGRLGPYEVFEVLGQGGMGVVLKARDPALDRTVAIKVLTPALAHGATARRRFAREARAAAAVGHEHIVAIHAVDEFRGLLYLVMQYIPGRSLQERLDASGPLEVKEILRIGTQAARALAAAHAQGVVHRDIKPANILLENSIERVKLTDFGLARAIDDVSLTQSGIIAGTPQYMAPEQARGEPVDARSDLFSLGAVLYAMASGRSPFRADSAMAVLKRVCDDRHRSIRELNPDIPDWLEAVIDRLLAKDPADRFQTAAEVADLLERGLAHVQQPTAVPRPVVPGVPGPSLPKLDFDLPVSKPAHRPHRKLAVAAGFVLLALAGLGASEAAGLSQLADFVATILRIKIEDNLNLPFANDDAVLGRWTSVDFVAEPGQFNPGKKNFEGDLYLKDLTFLGDGKTRGPWTWTKGVLIHPDDKTASKYEIKRLGDKDYLFLEWKSGDYTISHMKPKYYVLTRDAAITTITKGPIVDKIDLPFVNDPAVIGTWKSVDFVDMPSQFNPGKKNFEGDLYLKDLTFLGDGKTRGVWTWTKGVVIHSGDKTAAKYEIKKIGDKEYLFLEWKSGDYTIRHMKPKYYVLKK